MPVKFDLGSKLGKICGGKIQNKIKFCVRVFGGRVLRL
ncbi:hypothetical protein CAMRE0001_0381 [Campylobacter rectus RM3267]|uniref:Uncharacterized protein n=1 Tax=Campylobacter rectus RM3267 TaxID=553218 RepID=B9D2F1_CAMRE|nr:hypothetical protein CAMRE0001_0381 [Campylobacter rectus RM3267]